MKQLINKVSEASWVEILLCFSLVLNAVNLFEIYQIFDILSINSDVVTFLRDANQNNIEKIVGAWEAIASNTEDINWILRYLSR